MLVRLPAVFGTIVGSIAVLAATAAWGADAPPPKLALSFRPVQKDVEIETPDESQIGKCEVKVERIGKSSGWIVLGPQGQTLRRYVDTNGDNVVDQWRYYNQGLEVYRDIDSNFNNKVDQSRWLNTAGSRWGIDSDEDGRIDSWKSISAEELSREAIKALVAGDDRALQALMITQADADSLGLHKSITQKLLESASTAKNPIAKALAGSKIINGKTQWMRFDSNIPGVIPADESKATVDLVIYENAMAIVDSNGEPGLVQLGELLRVGDAWKLTQVPQVLDGNSVQVTIGGGILMQPLDAISATGAIPGSLSPEVQQLLGELQDLDRQSPAATSGTATLAKYNTQRADLLNKLVSISKTEDERQQWTRQLIDGIAASVQTGAYPEGMARLKSLEASVRESDPKSPLLPYAAYRRLLAEYSSTLQTANAEKREETQKWWLEQLQGFAEDYPTAEDTPDALLQLAIATEFRGDVDGARKWYAQIVADHASAAASRRASGAIRRIDLKGKKFNLSGTGMKGETVSTSDYRGKVLLILFWATWCKPCSEDLPQIRQLYQEYHSKGFEIVGVNVDNEAAPAAAYLTENRVVWPQIREEGGLDSAPALELGVFSLPTMILIDKTGTVAQRSVAVDDLKKELPELLKK